MDLSAEMGFLVADGKRMGICFPSISGDPSNHIYLVSDYCPISFSVSIPTVEVQDYGGFHLCTRRPEVTIEIEIKAHEMQSIQFEEGIKLFRNADSLSVNELLAIAYQKMDKRQT